MTTRRQESGRWHEAGRGNAQYFALSAEGAWAERVRYDSIRDNLRREADRRRLWQLLVKERDIADLRSFDAYRNCGLDPRIAIGAHRESRLLARQLRKAGYRGVLSPSAALDIPGALNLTLFGERLEEYIEGLPLPGEPTNPDPEIWLPTVMLVDAGSPTEYSMRHTCYRHGHHRTFASWKLANP